MKTALIVAMSAIVLVLVLKDVVIRDVLGIVELRRDPSTMSMSTFVTLLLIVSLLILGFAFTAVDYAIWRRSKDRSECVDSPVV